MNTESEKNLADLEAQVRQMVESLTFSKVSLDQPLLSTQLLDSIGVVDLVVEIEKKWAITFDLQHVNENSFNTVQQIAQKIFEVKKV